MDAAWFTGDDDRDVFDSPDPNDEPGDPYGEEPRGDEAYEEERAALAFIQDTLK